MGFFDVSKGRTADNLFSFLATHFEKFNLTDKLVGQTYDGASVMSGELNGLQMQVKTIAPQALFTHCYAHRLNLILQNSVASIQECKIFFATISGISAFFSKSTKRTNILDSICGRRIPRNVQTRWNFNSRIVNTVLVYRNELPETFEEITQSADFAKDSVTIREAIGYINFLNEFNNLIFLKTFNMIFEQTDIIYSIVQSKTNDILYCKNRIENLVSTIKTYRNNENKFIEIYNFTVSILGEPSNIKKRKLNFPDNKTDCSLYYKRIYYEILDLIITQIEVRFSDFENLKIFDLLNSEKFVNFNKSFPMSLLNRLLQQYPKLFNKEKLENELKVLYSDVVILGVSVELKDRLKFIVTHNLENDVPEIFKLLSLILSLPSTSASVERSFSALKRIKTFARNTMTQERLRSLAMIAIEKDFLCD